MWEAVIRQKRKELLARDAYVFGYSIVNRLEDIQLRSCLKASQERSLLSQPPPDDNERAGVLQMAELVQTCAAQKSAHDAAVKKISALEKQYDDVCHEMTSFKLQQLDQVQSVREW